MHITKVDELRKLYGEPGERAQKKVLSGLDSHAKQFIERSPFFILSTCSAAGKMDSSPRGGSPGFVKIMDNNTLVIPDSKGNNRLDSLKNIIEMESIGSLFLVPGMDETLRVNGKAAIRTDKKFLDLFSEEKNPPATCIVLSLEEVFYHCAKALMRSKLWSQDAQIERAEFPTMGQILNDQIDGLQRIESQEDMVERYKKDL